MKQHFDAYMTEGKKDWKGTFRHWILPPYNDWPRNRCKFSDGFFGFKKLCTHGDIIVKRM